MDFANGTHSNETFYYNSTYCKVQSEQLRSPFFQGIIYSMYSLIFLVSIIGNGMVCYIVIFSPRMRTVTNYFIMNLAVGDILITVLCIPSTAVSNVLQYWPFAASLCPIVNYSQGVSVFVSAYTLVAISVDRYIAIMWPLRPRISKKVSWLMIFLVWTFAMVTALPIVITSQLLQPIKWYEDCDLHICTEQWTDLGYKQMYSSALLLLQYVIPVSVLLFTYTSIAILIWCRRIPGEAEDFRDQRIAKSKRKMIKMMITVVIVYTICWLPLNIVWIIIENNGLDEKAQMYLWFSSHWLAMSHTCYNPIIYCYMNTRFRTGFLQALSSIPCMRRCCTPDLMHHTQSNNFPLTSVGATDSTILQRNNTGTTYVSVSSRRKQGSSKLQQVPVRSASVMRNQQHLLNPQNPQNQSGRSNQSVVKRIKYFDSDLQNEL